MADDALESSLRIIRWATKEFDDIQIEWSNFVNSKPWEWRLREDADSNFSFIEVFLKRDMPDTLLRNMNNCFNNIKHSFDQSLHAVGSVVSPGRSKFNFPWGSDRSEVRRKCKSFEFDDELTEVIIKFGPYYGANDGGDDVLRNFAHATNPNKHAVTVGVQAIAQPSEYVWSHKKGVAIDGSFYPKLHAFEIGLIPVEIARIEGRFGTFEGISISPDLVFKGNNNVEKMLVITTISHVLRKANGFASEMMIFLKNHNN